MKDISTKQLVEELEKRDAVQSIWIPPYVDFKIEKENKPLDTEIKQGACHILIIWD